MWEYVIGYIFDGKEKGECVIRAESVEDAIYDFYNSHGFRYKALRWDLRVNNETRKDGEDGLFGIVL